MNNIKNIFRVVTPGICFLILWEFFVHGNGARLFFYSSPSQILSTIVEDVQTHAFWLNISYTGLASLLGLLIGTVLGSFLGIILWLKPSLEKISSPYISLLGAIPIFAIAPMLIVWFGIGLWSKIVMASLSVVLVSLVQAFEGASSLAKTHLIFAKTLGAKDSKVLRYIILPGACRHVLTGLKMNIGFAIMGTFIAEFISSEYGVGHYIIKAGGTYDTARVFVGIMTLGVMSLLAQWVVNQVLKKSYSHTL